MGGHGNKFENLEVIQKYPSSETTNCIIPVARSSAFLTSAMFGSLMNLEKSTTIQMFSQKMGAGRLYFGTEEKYIPQRN